VVIPSPFVFRLARNVPWPLALLSDLDGGLVVHREVAPPSDEAHGPHVVVDPACKIQHRPVGDADMWAECPDVEVEEVVQRLGAARGDGDPAVLCRCAYPAAFEELMAQGCAER